MTVFYLNIVEKHTTHNFEINTTVNIKTILYLQASPNLSPLNEKLLQQHLLLQ